MLLANDLITLVTKYKPVFGKSPITIPRNPLNYTILDSYVFKSFILADEPFVKALRVLATCALIKNNLCGTLVSSLDSLVTFDERFKVI